MEHGEGGMSSHRGEVYLHRGKTEQKTLDGSEKPFGHMAKMLLIRNLVIQTQIHQSV